jgi:hypothetical protein
MFVAQDGRLSCMQSSTFEFFKGKCLFYFHELEMYVFVTLSVQAGWVVGGGEWVSGSSLFFCYLVGLNP